MSEFNFSFELHEFDEALTPYGTIDTRPPEKTTLLTNDFSDGQDFRTAVDPATGNLCLELEDRILTILLDESGSMTWNDNNADRYIYIRRLLTKLEATYPGTINTNLIGFGGVLTTTNLFLAEAGIDFLTEDGLDFSQFLQQTLQDSVYDFAGVRVVRRTDRFPTHPADGVVVAEGIIEAAKDENLIEDQEYFYGVWTFNKNNHFSLGQFVKATPRDRILPTGVSFASAEARILPGVERDSSTELIFSFVEGSGFLTFDSSGVGRHGSISDQAIEESFWSGDAATSSRTADGTLKKSVGVRFDGEFDIIETVADADIAFQGNNITDAHANTVNFWLFRYPSTLTQWVLGTSTDAPSNTVGWAVLLENDGNISIVVDDNVDNSSSFNDVGVETIPLKIWTMVTVVFGLTSASLYINGSIQGSITYVAKDDSDTSNLTKMYIGGKPEDSSAVWSGSDFFGALNQISIHKTTRNAAYISDMFTDELPIFNQPLNSSNAISPDNKQREVLISYNIGIDFDFQGGSVKAMRKYKLVPSHVDDGEEVFNVTASASGQIFFMDSFDFINNGDYYYRLFTINSVGNICDRLEARILPVHIPASINETAVPSLETVTGEQLTEGDKKLFLQWLAATDSRIIGTKIFFSLDGFPAISISAQGKLEVSDGSEVIDTTTNSFVHRTAGDDCEGADLPLVNGRPHYYTLVHYDRLGRVSDVVHLFGIPSTSIDVAFIPEEVRDVHAIVLNPQTISIRWENPTVKTNKLRLYFGEAALAFVSVKDIFGGNLDDITNLQLKVCTNFTERGLATTEQTLGAGGGLDDDDSGFNPRLPCGGEGEGAGGGRGSSGARFDENCNSEQEEAETILTFATVESGLIKGIVAHTNDRLILSRRERYEMLIRAEYKVQDPDAADTEEPLFQFFTKPVSVSFQHPVRITLINKLNAIVALTNEDDEVRPLDPGKPCRCEDTDTDLNTPDFFSGGFTGATRPYVCRCEVQFKGEALPDGTPINVFLFKHGKGNNPNPLNEKSDRTFIREGLYNTSSVLEEELDFAGNPTGRLVSKSIVDIEVPHPDLPDFVDIYVSLDYLGFFVDAVHDVRFFDSLFIQLDATKPFPDGIDVSEQFATVWKINPDNPDETIDVPDGTLVKWELIKKRHGKERPFYSLERFPVLISGVYSTTISGVARNVFFGPIGNMEEHFENVQCDEDDPGSGFRCCINEEYEIHASVILNEESAKDAVQLGWECRDDGQFTNRRFFVNAADDQPGSNPHWITWADGSHLIKFQIAKNPAIVTDEEMLGATCFRNCVEQSVGGQLFQLPDEHIIQISAPGEILWDVTFEEDPYTGTMIPIEFQSAVPVVTSDGEEGRIAIANIPIRGLVTDFYMRLNSFIGDNGNPKPQDCEKIGGSGTGGLGGGSDGQLPCEWRGVCDTAANCTPTEGRKWINVGVMSGTTTLIASNRQISLQAGGSYEEGIPPIYVGWKEPLDVRVIEARVNGERVDELIVDGVSQHTFVVEMTFTGEPVPDGTPIDITVEGEDQDIVLLSRCTGGQAECSPASNGRIYTRQINDPLLNPSGAQRSLAFFSIDPLPNVDFGAKINVIARYDELKTVERELTRCIEVSNSTSNTDQGGGSPGDTDDPVVSAATSNEAIVYDTIQDLYETVPSGQLRRIGAFAEATTTGSADSIYVFGGYTGNGEGGTTSLTAVSEIFNTSSLEWEFTADMPTARGYGQTVESGGTIYCIGGVELDPLLSRFSVSRKIESFDTFTELWNNTLSPMPEDYGVAYGEAVVVGDFIYVLCGINEIVDSSKAGKMNDRIVRYNITQDSWSLIVPSNINLYSRIAPFGFYRSNPLNSGQSDEGASLKQIFIYGGSIPKNPAEIEIERTVTINRLLDQFRSFILTSSYYLNLTPEEQQVFIEEKEEEIRNGVIIPAFIYPSTGFKFHPTDDITAGLAADISDTLDDEWRTLPLTRDHGRAIYVATQDFVYLIGGGNQNKATTLNRNESIALVDNTYIRNTPLSRGRAMFEAVDLNDDIYLIGGLTSGHADGWIQIEVFQMPEFVEAIGTQSGGLLITLKNDSGEIIEDSIRLDTRGRVRIPEVDSILIEFQANRAADRALGGDGSGNAPGLPEPGEEIDISRLQDAQNKITDPNSDQFQFNAARKLNEQVELFPVLYSSNEFIVEGGVGGVSLLPRSEDPFADFQKLAEFIKTLVDNTPIDTDERFTGDLTREELAALGDTLETVDLPPTIIDSGALRELYDIESVITVLEADFFGQTISDFDLDVQDQIESRIEELLTPPPPDDDGSGDDPTGGSPAGGPGAGIGLGGPGSGESECLVLQHAAQPDIPPPDTPTGTNDPNNPAGTGGFSQSGQCLFCESLLPLNVNIRSQLPTILTKYFNATDWIPQIKKRLVGSTSTIAEILEAIDVIDAEVPFGSSQLYNAMLEGSRTMTGDTFGDKKKVMYIVSDNSQNLSLITRDVAIEEVNAVDGDRNTPVVYTVFSTSFPLTLAALLQRAETGDVDKITQATGGQSTTLIASGFMDQILNLTLGGATGGLGYGIFTDKIDLSEISAITAMSVNFDLKANTQGFVRFRHSSDGFNFTDFSERFEGTNFFNFVDFFARYIEYEVVLTTGFTVDIAEEYDTTATGVPCLIDITWELSGERQDFIFVDSEDVLTNAQQVAMAFEGTVPESSLIELGVATSNSHNWNDFQSAARPIVNEFGKTFLLERSEDVDSIVPIEPLTTIDQRLYKTTYGPWDPTASVDLLRVVDGVELPVFSGFRLYPRKGEVYFNTRQPPTAVFKMAITNDDVMRVGMRLRNRLHTQAISVEGVGYIYSTNDDKPAEISQVAPRAINVFISPQNPNAGDTIFALYTFIDLNNDPESGTILSWFKNGVQLLEIQNAVSFTDDNLLLSNKIQPDDRLQFSVTPSDGRDFGVPVFSPPITIVARPPDAEDTRIVPTRNGVINSRFDTSSTFSVSYSFQVEDEGPNAVEDGTIVRWFVNGLLFKEGTFSQLDVGTDGLIVETARQLLPSELNNGVSAHEIGNQIQAEVTPKTAGGIVGTVVRSQTVTVENSLPIAANVSLEPLLPSTQNTLIVTFDVDDFDIDRGTQTDQSEIIWFNSPNGTDFAEVSDLKDETTAPPFFLRAGEHWRVEVRPFDGLDLGVTSTSNTVIIQA